MGYRSREGSGAHTAQRPGLWVIPAGSDMIVLLLPHEFLMASTIYAYRRGFSTR